MIDQRPTKGSEVGTSKSPTRPRHAPRRRSKGEWTAAGAVLAVGLAVVAFLLTRTDTATKAPSSSSVTDPVTTGAASSAPPASATSTAPPVSASPSPSTAVPTTAVVAPPATNKPVRWAVFDHGKVILRGEVPDQATAATIIAKAALVVGPANVVDEYTIDTAAARPDSAPLYVADTILFDTGSAVLRPEFTGLLNLGLLLLTQNPKVTITIIGHTDNVGAAAMNLALSQRRVDAAISFIVAHRIDRARLTGVAKGLTEPVADNSTPEGRRANRRVEFVITGLLD